MGQAAAKTARRLPTEAAKVERIKEVQGAAQAARAAQKHSQQPQQQTQAKAQATRSEPSAAPAAGQTQQQAQPQEQRKQPSPQEEASFLEAVKKLHITSREAPEAEFQQHPSPAAPPGRVAQEQQPAAQKQAAEHARAHEEAMLRKGHEERTQPNAFSLQKESASSIQQRHADELLEHVEGRLNFKQLRAVFAMHQHDPSKFTPAMLASRVKVDASKLETLFKHATLPDALLMAVPADSSGDKKDAGEADGDGTVDAGAGATTAVKEQKPNM
ncbi:hypothetical protein PTSG_09758 [Salpingoeca rosetta]|uniref:Uncharacterized protein n=1 Tax=Salpingoeca rosetta (strain ATCC 50818 / BSB-021) TaxID=946362 RepID=F2UNY9_SALR5|nr:uncharacterized protein PTSG_09758 [Salpingoeca rosetta]EGD79344.1 hypothetical protein PTSG_09758 [Salpingoeca rosetta]|eukprot:XP_004989113.1 hypothetical protein PTSG_09758 [Salpingoeca rosetta]